MKPQSFARWAALAVALVMPLCAGAGSHDLRIDTGEIRDRGEQGIEVHMNLSRPGADAAGPPRRALRLMPEYGYGFARNWELALGLPVSRIGGDVESNGGRANVKYVSPHDPKQGAYWGALAQITYLRRMPDRNGWIAELKPVAGVRIGQWHLVGNLAFTQPLSGADRDVELDPAAMVMMSIGSRHELGVEYHGGLGPIRNFLPRREQEHLLVLAWNYEGRIATTNFGVGRGLTDASDRWVVKLIADFKLK